MLNLKCFLLVSSLCCQATISCLYAANPFFNGATSRMQGSGSFPLTQTNPFFTCKQPDPVPSRLDLSFKHPWCFSNFSSLSRRQHSQKVLQEIRQKESPLKWILLREESAPLTMVSANYPYTNDFRALRQGCICQNGRYAYSVDDVWQHILPPHDIGEISLQDLIVPEQQGKMPPLSKEPAYMFYDDQKDPNNFISQVIPLFSDRTAVISSYQLQPKQESLGADKQSYPLKRNIDKDIEEIANANKKNSLIISMADIHGNTSAYGGICEFVEKLMASHKDSFIVIPGDLMGRQGKETVEDLERLDNFLDQLSKLAPGRVVFALGNHDVQECQDFFVLIDKCRKCEIPVLSNFPKSFNPRLGITTQPYIINGNTAFFPFCVNFANSGWNGKYNWDEEEKHVFTKDCGLELEHIDWDRYFRNGIVNAIEKKPGILFDSLKGIAQQFKVCLEELEKKSPEKDENSPLYLVMLAHEHPVKVLALFEELSQFPEYSLPERILKRLRIVCACGHEHTPFLFHGSMFLTTAEKSIACVPCACGGVGVYGTYTNSFALSPEIGQTKIVPEQEIQRLQNSRKGLYKPELEERADNAADPYFVIAKRALSDLPVTFPGVKYVIPKEETQEKLSEKIKTPPPISFGHFGQQAANPENQNSIEKKSKKETSSILTKAKTQSFFPDIAIKIPDTYRSSSDYYSDDEEEEPDGKNSSLDMEEDLPEISVLKDDERDS